MPGQALMEDIPRVESQPGAHHHRHRYAVAAQADQQQAGAFQRMSGRLLARALVGHGVVLETQPDQLQLTPDPFLVAIQVSVRSLPAERPGR